MKPVQLFAACAGVTVGLGFVTAVALAPAKTGPRPPEPTPTVTVTATATPSPSPTIPPVCLDMLAEVVRFYPAMSEYEEALGGTYQIQYLTMQSILQEDYVPLNEARQELIDLRNASAKSLIVIQSTRKDLSASIEACRKAVGQ